MKSLANECQKEGPSLVKRIVVVQYDYDQLINMEIRCEELSTDLPTEMSPRL